MTEQRLLYFRNYKKKNYARVYKSNENHRLKRKYGITLDEYNALLVSQNSCCAICGNHTSQYKRKLHVDHNHSNGKVRGLLCVRCNYGIGYFSENPELLDKAKLYIKSHFSSEI